MSALAGICVRDGRPLDRNLERLGADGDFAGPNGGGVVKAAPGIALRVHVLRFDRRSAVERQPVVFNQGSVLTWDGRLDNRDDLLVQLHRDLSADDGDAALVAAAYTRWGLDCLSKLVGDWSLALWDAETETLVLARDYMGNRPLYYRDTPGSLAWATCLQALVACFGLEVEPDDAFITGRLTFGVPPDITPFRTVRALRPGHVLVARRGWPVSIRRYWTFTPGILRYRNLDDYSDHLRMLLIEAVRVRLRADRPVWSHLSGGFDSSSIVCVAHGLVKRGVVEAPSLQPLSHVCTASPESDESVFINAVENWCGLRTVRREFDGLVTFPELLGSRQPYPYVPRVNLSAAVQANGDRVLLSGELGDEVMQGAARMGLIEPLQEGRLLRWLQLCFARAKATRRPLWSILPRILMAAYIPEIGQAFQRDRRLAWLARRGSWGRQRVAAFYDVRPEVVARAPQLEDPSRALSADFPRAKQEAVAMLYQLADCGLLMSSDKAPGIWTTFPYTHRPLVEFVLATPTLAFWDPAQHRVGMKRALADVLPPQLLARNGKGNPMSAVRRVDRDSAVDLASNKALLHVAGWQLVQRGYLESHVVERMLAGARAAATPTARLRSWLGLEAWLRTITACTTTESASQPVQSDVGTAAVSSLTGCREVAG